MKKSLEYYAVNNQEDEDGYTFYSLTKNIYENIKREQQITAPDNTSNKQPVPAKHSSRNHSLTLAKH
jgi:hypothetical protein